jgi:hypothetical protein
MICKVKKIGDKIQLETTGMNGKVIASNYIHGILTIPKEFIQVCLDNDEVNVKIHYDSIYGHYENPKIIDVTPVEKVQEIEITTPDRWWNSLPDKSKQYLYNFLMDNQDTIVKVLQIKF